MRKILFCAIFIHASVFLFTTCIAASERSFIPEADGYVVHNGSYSAWISSSGFNYYQGSFKDPALTYSLRSIRLGGKIIIPASAPKLTSRRNIAYRSFSAGFSESYTASSDGIEQCWIIDSRPSSPGGIIIEADLRSSCRPVRHPGKWRFMDKHGKPFLYYGSITAIDSRGQTYKCMPSIDGNKLTIAIPAGFVEKAAFPVVIDPVVGPETETCPTFNAALNNQEGVELAQGSNGYLAVWQDTRGGTSDIFGCRLNTTGEILDKASISISTATGDQSDPVASWSGSAYLVVWSDRRSNVQHIYAARVWPNGEVIDKQGILVSGSTGTQAYPRVASDGSGWEVVWQDARSTSHDIYGCRVNSDGSLGKVMPISTQTGNDEDTPDIAYNGSIYIVTWTDHRNGDADIYGGRVARTGIRSPGDILISCDGSGNSITGDQRNARVCAFGSSCMAIWEDMRIDSNTDIYGTRLTAAGAVVDRNGFAVSTANGVQETPAIAYNGNRILTTWRDHTTRLVKGARISTNGVVLDTDGIAISTSIAGSAGVSTCGADNSFLVGWNSLSMGGNDVLAAFVPNSGSSSGSAGTVISLGLNDQQNYSVAYNGNQYAVVWAQRYNDAFHIMGARYSLSGELLDQSPIGVTTSLAGVQTQPSIAWNGSKYLLVWCATHPEDTTRSADLAEDIEGIFLDDDLNPTSQTAITICQMTGTQNMPFTASNGTNWLVVWEDSRNAVSPYYYTDIYGAVVGSSGSITAMSTGVSLATGDQLNPKAASNGSNYFVVWEDYRNSYPLIYGARVTGSGVCSDTSGLAMPSTSYYQTTPDICYGDGNYLVAWSDYTRIMGCRVSITGTRLDTSGIIISSGASIRSNPSVCWNGTRYQFAWEDYRSQYSGNADVYYNTLTSEGIVSSSPELALAANLLPQLKPRIFEQGNYGAFFYSRYDKYANCVMAASLTEQDVQQIATVAEAKQAPIGTACLLSGKIVTASFSDCFYIEDIDRSSGIKVMPGSSVSVGDIVDVTGVIGISDGERQINTLDVIAMGTASDLPRPVGIRGDLLGGGALNDYTPGITGAVGLNNIGLLARTWGKVTSVASGYFIIECKTAVTIKVKSGSLSAPSVGNYVAITGISSCEIVGGAISRVILPRDQADIQVLN